MPELKFLDSQPVTAIDLGDRTVDGFEIVNDDELEVPASPSPTAVTDPAFELRTSSIAMDAIPADSSDSTNAMLVASAATATAGAARKALEEKFTSGQVSQDECVVAWCEVGWGETGVYSRCAMHTMPFSRASKHLGLRRK